MFNNNVSWSVVMLFFVRNGGIIRRVWKYVSYLLMIGAADMAFTEVK
jgi:hypothetical protein